MKNDREGNSGSSVRRNSYLDAAERVFIRMGYEGASMRIIAAEAGAGIGTLTYHWNSKESFLQEVFERRLGPVRDKQFEGLRDCQHRLQQGETVELKEIISAWVCPSVNPEWTDKNGAEAIRQLYGAVLTEPSEGMAKVITELFHGVTFLLHALTQEVLSNYEPDVFHWLYSCALGVTFYPTSFRHRVSPLFGDFSKDNDWGKISDIIVGFIVRGMFIETAPKRREED